MGRVHKRVSTENGSHYRPLPLLCRQEQADCQFKKCSTSVQFSMSCSSGRCAWVLSYGLWRIGVY